MLNNLFTNHEDFCAYVQKNNLDQEIRSPFELRRGEHLCPMKSTRGKVTCFVEAEFLTEVNVINTLCFDLLRAIGELVVCTPYQVECYFRQKNIYPSDQLPTRKTIVKMARRLLFYQFIKIVRFECEESSIPTPYMMAMAPNGQRALYAKYGMHSVVIPYFDESMEVYKIKKTLSVNQFLQTALNGSYGSRSTFIREIDSDKKGIRPSCLVDNTIIESVRSNEKWQDKLSAKLSFYDAYFRLPPEKLNMQLENPAIVLVMENLEHLYKVEQMFHEGRLSVSCRVLLTCDTLAYNAGKNCPMIQILPTQKGKSIGIVGLFGLLRRRVS